MLTANEETGVGTKWQANQGSDPSEQVGWAAKRSADHKSAAQAAAQRKSNHVAHRGGGRHSPQVLMAWCGTTAGTQGRTGQRVSAADFFFSGPRDGRRSPKVDGVVWQDRGNPRKLDSVEALPIVSWSLGRPKIHEC